MSTTTIRSASLHRIDDTLPNRRGTRMLGAVVAVAIAAVPAFLGLVLGRSPFLAAGLPAAAIVGALLGPSVRAREPIAGLVVGMATLTIGVADVVVMLWLIAQASLAPSGASLGSATFGIGYVGVLGLFIVGIPMLLVTTPCAIVWGYAVRRLVERGHGIAVP